MMLNEIHYKLSLNLMSLFQNFCFIEAVCMWYMSYRTVG